MTLLYGWGANSHGQLGLGYVCEQVLRPTRVDDLPDNLCESTIEHVVGGGGHTFLLTSDGKLYGAGMNTSGQVGNGTQERSVPTFQQIRGLEEQKVVSVACGWSHSVALNSQGQVWVWGSNSHLQLGLPTEEVPFSCLPICLEICDVVSVAAGLRHTAVVTKDGHVYTWGQGHRGQLGHMNENGEMVKRQTTPRIVDMIESKVEHVTCGQNTTYALTSEGHVLAWGDNKWGQLAHNPKNVSFFTCPLSITENYFGGERLTWLRAGWTHCAAGMTSGGVYMWGRSDYGQLGPAEEDVDISETKEFSLKDSLDTQKSPARCRYIPGCLQLNKSINKFVCGSEHNLALADGPSGTTTVHSWGWNEHGSCGDGSTDNIKHPFKIPFKGNILLIGAGSGQSFALVKVL